MNPQIIVAAIIAAGGFIAGWQIQSWRYDAKELERVESNLELERIASAERSRATNRVIQAQSAGAQRANAARLDAASARDAADRLRIALDNAAADAQLSVDACTKHTATLRAIFDASVAEYRRMGEAADGHASDVKTLTDAWPK
jgi:hypothetical protein